MKLQINILTMNHSPKNDEKKLGGREKNTSMNQISQTLETQQNLYVDKVACSIAWAKKVKKCQCSKIVTIKILKIK